MRKTVVLSIVFVLAAFVGRSADAQKKSETIVINMSKNMFVKEGDKKPMPVEVQIGQKIKWVNRDNAKHDVRWEGGGMKKGDALKKDESFEWVVTGKEFKDGRLTYSCTLHEDMEGELVLKKGAEQPGK